MTTNSPDPKPGSLSWDAEAADLPEDTDDLELREDFSEELRASLEAVSEGEPTLSAKEVAQGLGLSW